MSLSYNPSLDPSHRDAIAQLEKQYDVGQGRLSITISPHPTRQGMHYKQLATVSQQRDAADDDWIMFTDDDDLWSPTRTATLTNVLADVGDDVDAVCIPWHVRHVGIPDVDRRVCLHAATALV